MVLRVEKGGEEADDEVHTRLVVPAQVWCVCVSEREGGACVFVRAWGLLLAYSNVIAPHSLARTIPIPGVLLCVRRDVSSVQ